MADPLYDLEKLESFYSNPDGIKETVGDLNYAALKDAGGTEKVLNAYHISAKHKIPTDVVFANYEGMSKKYGYSGDPTADFISIKTHYDNQRILREHAKALEDKNAEPEKAARVVDLIEKATEGIPGVSQVVKLWSTLDRMTREGIAGGVESVVSQASGAAKFSSIAGAPLASFSGAPIGQGGALPPLAAILPPSQEQQAEALGKVVKFEKENVKPFLEGFRKNLGTDEAFRKEFLGKVAGAVGGSIPTIGAFMLSPAAGVLVAGSQEFNESFDAYLQNVPNPDLNQAALFGMTVAASTAPLNLLGIENRLGSVFKGLKAGVRTRILKQMVLGVGGEQIEEGSQNIISNFFTSQFDVKDIGLFENALETAQVTLGSSLILAGAGGGIAKVIRTPDGTPNTPDDYNNLNNRFREQILDKFSEETVIGPLLEKSLDGDLDAQQAIETLVQAEEAKIETQDVRQLQDVSAAITDIETNLNVLEEEGVPIRPGDPRDKGLDKLPDRSIQEDLQEINEFIEISETTTEVKSDVELSDAQEKTVSDILNHLSGQGKRLSKPRLATLKERVKGDIRVQKEIEKGSKKLLKEKEKASRADLKRQEQISNLEERREQKINDLKIKTSERIEKIKLSFAERLKKASEDAKRKNIADRDQFINERADLIDASKQLQGLVNSLPRSIRGDFKGFPALTKVKTLDGKLEFLAKAESKINSMFDNEFRSQKRKTINRLIKKGTQKTKLARVKKFGNKVSDVFDEIKAITKRSSINNIQRLEEILEDTSLDADQVKEAKLLFWAFDGLKDADSKKLNQALELLTTLESSGKSFMQKAREAETKRIRGLKDIVIEDTVGLGNINEEEQIQIKEQQKSVISKMASSIDEFAFSRNDSIETLLDNIRTKGKRFVGAIHDKFTRKVFKATQDFHTRNNKDFSVLGDSLFDSFKKEGKTSKDAWKTLKDFDVKKENTGIFYKPSGVKTIQVPLSQWEAVQLWMWKQDKSLAPSFETMGWTDKTTAEVEKFITPSGVVAAKQMLAKYKQIGIDVNDVLFDVESYRMPLIDNYSPAHKKGADKESDVSESLDISDMIPASEKNRSHKERTKNKAPLRPFPAHRNFEKHVSDMNHYMAYARIAKDMRNTFGSTEVKNAIRQSTGSNTANSLLNAQIDDIIRGSIAKDKVDKFINPLIGNLAVSKLAFNLPSALKQLGSIPAYTDSIPTGEWASRFSQFFKDVSGNTKTLMDTDYMRNRLKNSHDRDLKTIASKGLNNQISGTRNLRDGMMIMTRVGDAGAIVAGGYPVYSFHREKALKAGKTQEEAHVIGVEEFAVASERAQQSSEIMAQGYWQRGGGLAKLFTMYMTSPIQYNRIMVNAIKAQKKGRITKTAALKTIGIYHVLLPQIFTAMGSLGVGAFADDPEKREKFWRRQLTALLVGNFNSVFIAGDAYEAVVKTLSEDEESFTRNLSIPLLDQLEDFIKTADDIEEDKLISAADNLMSALMSFAGLPYDPVMKALNGAWDSAFGETDHPILRLMGYSDYVLMENDKSRKGTKKAFKSLID